MAIERSNEATDLQQKQSPNTKYQIGDKVFYPKQGVCKIIEIRQINLAGKSDRFYILQTANAQKIMVPIKNAGNVFRPLITEQQIKQIFDRFQSSPASPDNTSWSKRFHTFRDKIKDGTIMDLAEIICALMTIKKIKKISWGEKMMLDNAKHLLISEIAASRNQTEVEVWTQIEAIFASKTEA